MDLQQCRKDAKRLARGWARDEQAALERGRAVLGERLDQRRRLSDAQHVIAAERGYRSWPEMVRAAQASALATPAPPRRRVVVTEYRYRPGEPVIVEVTERDRRVAVNDLGTAARKAGLPAGWQAVAERVSDEIVVNISRQGVVGLPIVSVGPCLETIVERIAYASLSLYQELLELQK